MLAFETCLQKATSCKGSIHAGRVSSMNDTVKRDLLDLRHELSSSTWAGPRTKLRGCPAQVARKIDFQWYRGLRLLTRLCVGKDGRSREHLGRRHKGERLRTEIQQPAQRTWARQPGQPCWPKMPVRRRLGLVGRHRDGMLDVRVGAIFRYDCPSGHFDIVDFDRPAQSPRVVAEGIR